MPPKLTTSLSVPAGSNGFPLTSQLYLQPDDKDEIICLFSVDEREQKMIYVSFISHENQFLPKTRGSTNAQLDHKLFYSGNMSHKLHQCSRKNNYLPLSAKMLYIIHNPHIKILIIIIIIIHYILN